MSLIDIQITMPKDAKEGDIVEVTLDLSAWVDRIEVKPKDEADAGSEG